MKQDAENTNNFEVAHLKAQSEKDHVTALRADSMGRKVVNQTVRMAHEGTVSEVIRRPDVRIANALHNVDLASATLSLNAELKAQGHAVGALIRPVDYGHGYDTDYRPMVAIQQVDGHQVSEK